MPGSATTGAEAGGAVTTAGTARARAVAAGALAAAGSGPGALTGVLAHPRIFRDAFRLRARDRGGIGLADWHNRLGVWTLPAVAAGLVWWGVLWRERRGDPVLAPLHDNAVRAGDAAPELASPDLRLRPWRSPLANRASCLAM